MRINRIRIIGAVFAVLLFFLLLSISTPDFSVFEFAPPTIDKEDTLTPMSSEIGRDISEILWGSRQLDLITLGFLLFVAGVSCSSMLRGRLD